MSPTPCDVPPCDFQQGDAPIDLEMQRNSSLSESGATLHKEKPSVQWQDLAVKVVRNKEETVILQPTTGLLNAGDLLAIMGPSGSGKTTMLDALSGRTVPSKVSGEVLFNGRAIPSWQRRNILSYVAQEDSLLGVFSVAETLRFATRFYHGYTSKEIEALEADALALVGLESARNTRVGDIFFKGLSGGQKRRLSLAVELVKKPAVLILDEPTSGLDSASAYGVMLRLCELAKAGHAVACTIHQPSTEIWDLFDKLHLLSAGHTVYSGAASRARDYFAAAGHPCPQYANPADHFLALVNGDFPDRYDASLLQHFADSDERRTLLKKVAKAAQAGAAAPLGGADAPSGLRHLSTFVTLCHRFTLNNLRNPGIYWVRLVMYVGLCLMCGLMYLGLGDEKDYSSINSRTSLLFYIAAFLVFMSVAVLPFFMMERPTFTRERMNGAYAVGPWVLANMVCALPGLIVISLLSTACVVPLAGLHGFGLFFTALLCSLFAAEGFMCLVGALVPHYIIGIALGAGAYGMFMLCEGAFKVKDDIPPWFIWVHYLGFHTYSYRVFMWNEFHSIEAFDDGAPFRSGADLLDFYSLTDVKPARELAILVGFGLVFHAAFALVLQFVHKGRR
uniref:ABC transporter domain-containing protein n=1 Tax=Prymnesium polylepis TaxID=72548 RepID=A0A7S4HE97_9EUKA|mmetsp:Transcript_13612/g.34738  ORF Transcript_13612/g.34738 Transcript_13612/m.34738 type:complete len:619 (+) Transcript_13612:73-1929(+)